MQTEQNIRTEEIGILETAVADKFKEIARIKSDETLSAAQKLERTQRCFKVIGGFRRLLSIQKGINQ